MNSSHYHLLIGAVIVAAAACGAALADPGSLAPPAEPGKPAAVSDTLAADWFFPAWADHAKFNQSVRVRDTESAVGRLSAQTKEISLKDLARMHGHLCDGLVISYVELRAVLSRLFPAGVVDRTDLRVVSKNGPCWVDAACWLTGARINFQTLRVDASVGDGFIVQFLNRRQHKQQLTTKKEQI